MKSTIKKGKTKSEVLTFDQLEPGKLYNYKAGLQGTGVVLCMTEIFTSDGNKRVVELSGNDAGEYWNTVMDAEGDPQHLGVTFTLFTDKLELSNE